VEARVIDGAATLGVALEAGATLPAGWYSDPEIHRLERERIFTKAWHCVGSAVHVAEPGSYFTSYAAHMPVVVTRDREGTLNAFANVCRHRGHIVAQGAGRRETLQCPYHAWTYGLDGSLRAAPRCDREASFDASELSLRRLRVETWGPLLFVNSDTEAAPLEETVGGLAGLVAESGLVVESLELRESLDWELDANWKVAVENYLECYHCPTAHPGFSKVIDVDPDSYRYRAEGSILSQFGPVRDGARGNGNAPYDASGPVRQAQYHFLFPSVSFNIEPGPPNFSVDTWRAISPDRTAGTTDYYFSPEVSEARVREIYAFSRQVADEDQALVESVQRGLDSGLVPQGHLLPESEQLIHRFQRLVFDALTS